MIEQLKDLSDMLLVIVAGLAAVAAAYRGAATQTARGMAPLVGDPPVKMIVPLTQRVDEVLRWVERLEERQIRADKDTAALRDEVLRTGRDLDTHATDIRGHEARIFRLERRSDNIERHCHLAHRAESPPPGSDGSQA
ncbi:MAG: hypothetical protein HY814_14285 [Candidatus Riflebacteria bacterium]|nr:hypothetical protein [Candidatus Riflebacteria bacterium]